MDTASKSSTSLATSPPNAAPLIAWFIIGVVAVSTRADPDLWGHLRFGLDILASRTLPSVDPYSFTQDRPWINHEWLSEALFAIAYRAGGTVGLLGLKILVVIAILWSIWWALGNVRALWRIASLGVIAWALLPVTLTIRPQLWSVLATVGVTILTRRRRWAWLPLLFVVWANLHGGWLVGLGVVIAAAARETVATRNWRLATAVVIACVGATLLTPYHFELWRFLAETVRLGRSDIQEWQPLWTAPEIVWVPWILTSALVLWATARRRLSWIESLAVIGLAGASLRVLRLVPFFVVVTWLWSIYPRHSVARPSRTVPLWLEALSIFIILATTWLGLGANVRCLSSGDWRPDSVAAAALQSVRGRLAVSFNWGEYAIWHWGPGLRVSIDGRRETVYSDNRIREQNALAKGEAFGFLERERPEYVWFPEKDAALKAWLPLHGYRIDVVTSQSFIGVRADLPRLALVPAVLRTPGCFPES